MLLSLELIAYQYLKRDWMLYKAEDGKLALWDDGEYLNSTNDIWVSKSSETPWAFQIMILISKKIIGFIREINQN